MTQSPHITDLLSSEQPYLTDGGFETTLVFYEGFDLPEFAAFTIMDTDEGRDATERYFTRYVELAKSRGRGYVLDTNTWRAGIAWAEPLGLSKEEILEANRQSCIWARGFRAKWESRALPIVINGVVGPAGDAYIADTDMSVGRAADIHLPQISRLAESGADMVSAITLTNSAEATGIVRAARRVGIPVVISFTLETDGYLPTGQSLGEAIAEVDAATDGYALYFMINCAHPDHFAETVNGSKDWLQRIGGVRANASRMSHAELDESEVLDDGDPAEFGQLHKALVAQLPNLKVLGGCCGTDHRHVAFVADHTSHSHAA